MVKDLKIPLPDKEFEVKGLADIEDLKALEDRITKEIGKLRKKETPSAGVFEDCPDCGMPLSQSVESIVKHLKSDPEKHGLLKTVEKVVSKEPEKRSVKQLLKEHDIFECKDCMKDVEEHLKAKGRKIVEAEKEESWFE